MMSLLLEHLSWLFNLLAAKRVQGKTCSTNIWEGFAEDYDGREICATKSKWGGGLKTELCKRLEPSILITIVQYIKCFLLLKKSLNNDICYGITVVDLGFQGY